MSPKVLDCTFRDGGYYNQWDFDLELVDKYLKAVQSAGVDAIEIGFRFSPKPTFYGPFAYSSDAFLRTLDLPSDIPIGVMVNGGDVTSYPIQKMFSPAEDAPIERVRIALHFGKIHECKNAAVELKSLGYDVGVNLMQAGGKSDQQIKDACKIIADWGVDFLYFADSLGNMEPDDVKRTVELMKGECTCPIGFHGHDNKGQALNNTMAAIKAGVTWVDSTVLGMGRGAGNTRTEYMFAEFRGGLSQRNDLLFSLVLKEFSALQAKYKWGPNLLYYLAALTEMHPTYIQEMISRKYSVPVILDGIFKLGHSESYSKESLTHALTNKICIEGTQSANNLGIRGRDVLVVAAGDGSKRHKKALIQYVIKRNPYVVCLNSSTEFPNKHVDIYAACDRTRLMVEEYSDSKPVLMPFFKDIPHPLPFYDYGLKVQPHEWRPEDTYCVIPGLLVAAYAFAALTAAGAKRILLAGFDGYGMDSELQKPMSEVFSLYNGPPIVAITPTSYNIVQQSVYEPEFIGE